MFIDLLPLSIDRLIVRRTILNDVDLLLKMDKQEVTQKYLGGIKDKSREERLDFLKEKIGKMNENYIGQLTVCLEDTPIGLVGFKIDEDNNIGEISYLFDEDYTNRGYCTLVCRKIIEIGFRKLDLKSIIADTVEGNNPSKRVLEKLGFQYKDSSIRNNVKFLNSVLYNTREI